MRIPLRALAASIAVTSLLAAAACSGDDAKKKSSATPPPPPSTPATSSSPAPAPAPAVDPLTGGKTSKHGVVGVKIDDTANGRPQANVDKADIVYIEEVEGGLTRLLAVFNSQLPIVEAVRSTRAADPEILAQYGKIAYVASGGARNPLQVLDASPLKTSINDRGGPGFQRDGGRGAPYNLTANLTKVAKTLKAPRAKSIGLTWAATSPLLKSARRGTHVQTRVGGTPVEFRYNSKTKRYARYIDGNLQHTAAGKTITTPNVIVQFCKVVPYLKDRDVLGNPNAYTHSVGKGRVVVFRDGKRIGGTWSRPKATSGTTYRNWAGKPIPLRPGGTWVVLVHRDAPLA